MLDATNHPVSLNSPSASTIHARWMVKLRWSMLVGQLVLFFVVQWVIGIPLPMVPLGIMALLGIASNIGLQLYLRRKVEVKEWLVGVVMVSDVVLLTGMLYVTGGPANPFSFLYLIYIALGIVVLRARSMWGLSLVALICYGCLFLGAGSHQHTIHNPHHMRLHLEGMWVAYAITTVFIGYFVTRMKRSLMLREAELAALNDLQMRSEKIAALAALAGGAVHEFSTPLSTIAVIAKELERQCDESDTKESSMLEDLQLIRAEVDRCKRISQELMTQAGETLGEANRSMFIDVLFANAIAGLDQPEHLQVDIAKEVEQSIVPLPPTAFAQMLRGMLKNAREASAPEAPVLLTAHKDQEHLLIEVKDQGCGIPAHILPRLGEPFFTTKPASQGHGLGLFLAKTLMERLGGELRIESSTERGTLVTMAFPLDTVSQAKESPQSPIASQQQVFTG